jgi:hypothetical protein
MRSVRLIQSAFYAALALAAGATAAVASHWAIDVAGDFLLAHDTFDGIEHHSRAAFVGIAVALSALVLLRFLWEALQRHSGSTLSVVRTLRTAADAPPWRFVALVVTIAVAGLAAMELADAGIAGAPIDGVADVFGGSLALGIGTTVTIAVAIALCVRALLRAFANFEPAIAAFIFRMLRYGVTDRTIRHTAFAPVTVYIDGARRLARRRGMRAPPFLTPG